MKTILFGRNGQLGSELQRVLAPLGDVAAVDYQEIDLQNDSAVEEFIRSQSPSVIVNASAYTAVDRAEQEQELAFQVNGRAPELMAKLALELKAAFIHVSTDYVFDGMLGRPYVETDRPNPLNIYGKSKLAGEQSVQRVGGAYLIFRTSWVYSMTGNSFVNKILEWARKNPNLRVVDDQVGNPTWARSLAEMIGQLLEKADGSPFDYFEKYAGVYHLAGRGYVSRFDMAKEIIRLASIREPGLISSLQTARTSEFPAPAERPLFSALDCAHFESTFGLRLPEWQSALEHAMLGD